VQLAGLAEKLKLCAEILKLALEKRNPPVGDFGAGYLLIVGVGMAALHLELDGIDVGLRNFILKPGDLARRLQLVDGVLGADGIGGNLVADRLGISFGVYRFGVGGGCNGVLSKVEDGDAKVESEAVVLRRKLLVETRIIIERVGELGKLSREVDGRIVHPVLGASAILSGTDVFIGDTHTGGVGERHRGNIIL
jgi:hypothetical protein